MKQKCCIWTTVAIAVAVVVAAIAVTLAVVLSRHNSEDKSAGTSLDDSISENATFPNGSFIISAQALKAGNPAMAPRELNATTLGQLGIRVDNSSLVAETGRLSFFYIWLPPSASSKQIRSLAQEASNNSNIGNIGVRFGDAHNINVVPLSLASVPRSGLSLLAQLPDSSRVYELQVRMSESMCSGASRGACTVISWRPYSISSDASTGEGGDFSTSLPVACGSQCDAASDSPCASSSCQKCDGQQVAGADTPVTRRYNMGNTSGTLNFRYETYTVKDRVLVVYENQNLLDSGCVGTQGERQATISFSGSSQELRVDVEPNCEGTTGTAWYFQLPCLSSCDGANSRDNGVTLKDGNNEIKEGGTAYITEDALMPALTATACDDSIQWTLKITRTADKDTICMDKTYRDSGRSWNIRQTIGDGDNVQGGDATLSWTGQQNSGSLTFKILGTNPSNRGTIDAEINAQPRSSDVWFAKYIARAESNLQQFHDGYPIKHNDPGGTIGYGLFQLTYNPLPTCAQLWSWKKNVQAGVAKLVQIRTGTGNADAQGWMNGQRKQARDEKGHDVPVPDQKEGNKGQCIFKEGTSKVIEDAVAMKMYNCASKKCLGNYCYWDNMPVGEWKFNRERDDGTDYVNRVCSEI